MGRVVRWLNRPRFSVVMVVALGVATATIGTCGVVSVPSFVVGVVLFAAAWMNGNPNR